MSIYATIVHFGITRFGDGHMIDLYAQAVPAHVDYTGPEWEFLPPPVPPDGQTPRAVVFVEPSDAKGTPRCGQEYVRPLLVLTGTEYEQMRFGDLIERLEEALDLRYGTRPRAVVIDSDGMQRNVF